MKRTLNILIGIIGVLVGFGFILPALALLRHSGVLPGFEVGLLLLGIGLTVGGGGAILWTLRKQQS